MPELITIVREQKAATKQLLQQIELRQSPSAHYDLLLEFLKSLCGRVDSEIEVVSNLLRSNPPPEAAIELASQELLVFFSHVLREIHYYCECFDHAERLTIPNSMMQILNKFARDIIQANPFVLRGTLQFNYMYNPIGRQLNRLVGSIPESTATIDDNFAIFSFPLANSRNIFANCALLHEFGHLVVDSLGLIQQLGSRLLPETQEKIEDIVKKHAQIDKQADFDIMERISSTNKILENWIHESLADMIGLHLLGPAYLFTFIYWIQLFQSHQVDDPEHPCNSNRLKLMLDGAGNLGWQDLLRQETPSVWERARRTCQLQRQEGDYQYDAATECLAVLGQTIFDVVRDVCSTATYQVATFASCKKDIVDLLEHGIPPAEILDSTSGRFHQFDAISILNAGWLFYEKGTPTWEDRFAQLDPIKRGELLNRLLTKAIEVSFVKDASLAMGYED